MPERAAVNASPLIFLAKAGMLDLLQLAGNRVVVPHAVAAEVGVYGPDDPVVLAMQSQEWIDMVPTPPVPPIIQSWDLGAGESAVLAWGHRHPGTEVILDDLAARNCAAALGIPVRGTLGLVLTAKRRGRVAAARPILGKLRAAGMYLSDRTLNDVLKLAGE